MFGCSPGRCSHASDAVLAERDDAPCRPARPRGSSRSRPPRARIGSPGAKSRTGLLGRLAQLDRREAPALADAAVAAQDRRRAADLLGGQRVERMRRSGGGESAHAPRSRAAKQPSPRRSGARAHWIPDGGAARRRGCSVLAVDALLSLFPPGSDVAGDGMLRIGGCRADALAAEFGTPVLVVAEQALRDAGARVRATSWRRAGRARASCSPRRRSRARPCSA